MSSIENPVKQKLIHLFFGRGMRPKELQGLIQDHVAIKCKNHARNLLTLSSSFFSFASWWDNCLYLMEADVMAEVARGPDIRVMPEERLTFR